VNLHTGLSPDSRGANGNLYVILEGQRSYRHEPWQRLAANRRLEGGDWPSPSPIVSCVMPQGG